MIDKKARQERLEAANKFLAYFSKVGYHYFHREEWPYVSHIELRTLSDGYRQSCYFVDGGTGEREKIVYWSARIREIIGTKARGIIEDLKNFVMKGQTYNPHLAAWRDMPRGIPEKARELGIE